MATSPQSPAPSPRPAAGLHEPGTDGDAVAAGIDERPQRRREWAGGLRSVVLPLLALAAIVGAVWYLQVGRGDGTHAEGGGIVALPADRNPTGRAPAAEIGRAAPDFLLPALDGGSVRLSDLRGRVVLLNFWASWCQPCRQEIPELVRAQAEHGGRGLSVVAVDVQEAQDPVRSFAQQFGMRFPVAFDRSGEVARTFRVAQDLPAAVVIDRTGVVRVIRNGPLTARDLREQLTPLLDAPP